MKEKVIIYLATQEGGAILKKVTISDIVTVKFSFE